MGDGAVVTGTATESNTGRTSTWFVTMVLSSATSPNNGTKPQKIKSRKIRKWEKYIESYNYNCPRIHRHLANRAFAVAAPSSWNSLPENVRDSESYSNRHLEFMVSYRKFRLHQSMHIYLKNVVVKLHLDLI